MADQPSEPVLRFDNVTVRFEGDPALEQISFAVYPGETRVLFGAAGSGKTVLLKTALGLVRPDEGRVFLFGQDITNLSEEALFDIRPRVGILFQESALFDSLTIEENVAYPLLNRRDGNTPEGDPLPKVKEALRFVELEQTLAKFPSELSGGMRRRVGIARAAVTEPALILYDSPTAGLDPITANLIITLLVKEREQRGTTSLIVTHRYQDGEILAQYRYDREHGKLVSAPVRDQEPDTRTKFMVFRDGRLVFEGTQRELENASDPYVKKFVRHEQPPHANGQ